jgi:RHS repeat-associated protein
VDLSDESAWLALLQMGGINPVTGEPDRRMDLNGDGDVSQADFDLWDVAYRQARQQPTGNPAAPWMDDAPFNGVAEGGVLTVPTRSGTSAAGGMWVMHGVDNRFGFAGYMWDPFLKLYHVRHRVYDPMAGRWLQRDPIGMAGGWNLYQYCGGEPWGFVDPSGLILDDFIDGMREVRDLFTGRAAEEDARWDAANSKAVGNCFKQAKKLEQEGKPEQAAQVRCICSQMQKGTLAASNQLLAIRQQQWTDIGDTARNSIVATVGVLVAPAALLGQVGFNVAGNMGLEALYGGDLRSAAMDGVRDGVLGWGIGRALRSLGGALTSRTGQALLRQADDLGRGRELASPGLLAKLQARGYHIWNDAEAIRHLNAAHANASTPGDGILALRPDARHVEVLEEYLHNVQRRLGIVDRIGVQQSEIHVKEFMINHHRMLGISSEDAGFMRQLLEQERAR